MPRHSELVEERGIFIMIRTSAIHKPSLLLNGAGQYMEKYFIKTTVEGP